SRASRHASPPRAATMKPRLVLALAVLLAAACSETAPSPPGGGAGGSDPTGGSSGTGGQGGATGGSGGTGSPCDPVPLDLDTPLGTDLPGWMRSVDGQQAPTALWGDTPAP